MSGSTCRIGCQNKNAKTFHTYTRITYTPDIFDVKCWGYGLGSQENIFDTENPYFRIIGTCYKSNNVSARGPIGVPVYRNIYFLVHRSIWDNTLGDSTYWSVCIWVYVFLFPRSTIGSPGIFCCQNNCICSNVYECSALCAPNRFHNGTRKKKSRVQWRKCLRNIYFIIRLSTCKAWEMQCGLLYHICFIRKKKTKKKQRTRSAMWGGVWQVQCAEGSVGDKAGSRRTIFIGTLWFQVVLPPEALSCQPVRRKLRRWPATVNAIASMIQPLDLLVDRLPGAASATVICNFLQCHSFSQAY